ncbi:hypothetical protein ABIA35_005488 [Catenulispora sp. MAP12-49]|uniref:hypothetical protein n=1 Tax=unclassified Catenulispora TaxID=414885 RepID=UPI0035131FC8
MTVRLRTSVIPGLLALTALSLAACASQGTIGAGTAGGTVPGTGNSTSASGSANGSSTGGTGGTSAPSSADTGSSAPSAATGSSPAAPSSQDPSVLASSLKELNSTWTDQGCKTALAGFGDYVTAQQKSVLQAVATIPASVQKIHIGAQQTKKPGAADAMNKLATDMQTIFTQAQQGQTPNNGPVKSDFQVMGNICSAGNQ